MTMRKWIIIGSLVVILSVMAYVNGKNQNAQAWTYPEYKQSLLTKYADEPEKILAEIEAQLNDQQQHPINIGNALLLRQERYYLERKMTQFLTYFDETEQYLKAHDQNRELMHLYSMIASECLGQEDYQCAYLFIVKGETLARQSYEQQQDAEILSTLVAITYLKATTALDNGMEQQAKLAFAQAQELEQQSDIRPRIDVYANQLNYYYQIEADEATMSAAQRLIDLIMSVDPQLQTYAKLYIRANVILAEMNLKLGQVAVSRTIMEQVITNEQLIKANLPQDDIYYLYAKFYHYYQQPEQVVLYLTKAYDEIADSTRHARKFKLIQLIIPELQKLNRVEELVVWYERERELIQQRETSEDTQYLMNQLVDTDLQNANYNIEVLELTKSRTTMVAVTSVLLLIILAGGILVSIRHRRLLQENIRALQGNMSIREQYYENIRHNYESIKLLKHDLKNHLLVISQLNHNQQYHQMTKYIGQIHDEFQKSAFEKVTAHELVDALVTHAIQICDQEAIQFDYTIELPAGLAVADFDLCVIYGNLLDNAIEACKLMSRSATQPKKIWLKTCIQGDYLILVIKNSHQGNVQEQNNRLLTQKADHVNHGLGLLSVENVVKKYAGELQFEYTKTQFQVSVMIELTPN